MYGYTHDQIIIDEMPVEASYEEPVEVSYEEPQEVIVNDDVMGMINYPSVNVRSTPTKEPGVNNVVKVLTKGTDVIITESTPDDKWYAISFDDGNGYVMQEFVDLV